MEFTFWKEFKKKFKKLQKKYSSLKDDLDNFYETLELDPMWESLLSSHRVKISWLWENIKWRNTSW
jgi:mRNA-degrading endonuclease YafQ of YafQ-DinJ toxin-antitoxin module